MTEDDAKTKWCPMRRITRIGDVRIDNTDGKEFTLNCIGSACMMWRWNTIKLPIDGLEPGKIYPESEFFREANDTTSGYCGIAGVQANPPPIAMLANPSRRIGKGVYNNPQPGDADYVGGER